MNNLNINVLNKKKYNESILMMVYVMIFFRYRFFSRVDEENVVYIEHEIFVVFLEE